MTSAIRPQDFTALNASPFMTWHGARTQKPLESLLADSRLFSIVRPNLRPGDRVTLCRYAHGDWTKATVREYAEVIITEVTPKDALFSLVGEICKLDCPVPDKKPEKISTVSFSPPPPAPGNSCLPPAPPAVSLEVIETADGKFVLRKVNTKEVVPGSFATRNAAAKEVMRRKAAGEAI